MTRTICRSSIWSLIAGALVAPALLYGQEPDSSGLRADTLLTRAPAVRIYEAISIPFVASDERRMAAGSCSDSQRGMQDAPRSALRIGDTLTIRAPIGTVAAGSLRFLIAKPGPYLAGLGHAIVPAAIVRVAASAPTSGPALAEVVAQFDLIDCRPGSSDLVLTFDPPDTTAGRARPVAVTSGRLGSVAWVASGAVLPTLQHELIIDLGADAGLRPGDQVTVFRNADDVGSPTEDTAVATVLRVGPNHASAIIISQLSPWIRPGMPVRVSAKLP